MATQKDGNNIILTAAPDNIVFADLKNKQACKDYADCISGTFQAYNLVCSILVANGKVINNSSAHSWLGYPDSCLIYYKDGTFAVKRLLAIPDAEISKVQWAISGVGLLDMYEPEAEVYAKFTKNGKTYDYSDVLRRTNHTVIGVKDGQVYGLYLANMTGAEVNQYCKNMDMDFAVLLDGGHIAAVNCDAGAINTSQKQSNIIQFVQSNERVTKEVDSMTKKVFIGVGHGGTDAGAAANGLKEKDINLAMALAMRDVLVAHGVNVLLSRSIDEEDTVTQEVSECNAFAPDLAIDVHNNAGGGIGFEAYHSKVGGTSKTLAANIEAEVIKMGQKSRGCKTKLNTSGSDYFAFIRQTVAPAVIVEGAFLDNTTDAAKIDTLAEQKAFGLAYAKGVLQTLGIEYKANTSTSTTTQATEQNTASAWAKDSWQKAINKGIVDGSAPQAALTREMFATVLDRLNLI